jgi:hypothetical protein
MSTKGTVALSILILFFSCKDVTKSNQVSQHFVDSLRVKQVGSLKYWISIPTGFEITEREGPDFSVYYFVQSDTTKKSKFSGGMYFGNYASKFPPNNDSCKVETINSKILDQNSDWTLYECQGVYSVQTIVASNSGEGWNNEIHAFGHGGSKNDLFKILKIYSTLHKKK